MCENISWLKIRSCAENEKKRVLFFVNQLLVLADDLRCEGIDAFQKFLLHNDDQFMQKAIDMVSSGYEPELLSEILYTTLLSTNVCDIDYLEYVIFIRFILIVQKGDLPVRQIKSLLESYLGIDFISSDN